MEHITNTPPAPPEGPSREDLLAEVGRLNAEVVNLNGVIANLREHLDRLGSMLRSLDTVEGLITALEDIEGVQSVTVEDPNEDEVTVTLAGVRLDDDRESIVPAARSYEVIFDVPLTVTVAVEVERARDADDAEEQARELLADSEYEWDVTHRVYDVQEWEQDRGRWGVELSDVRTTD